MNTITKKLGPVAEIIAKRLTETYNPSHLEIINESHMHSVPKDSETHFKVVIVSSTFKGQSILEKHRSV
jgi:stress-induced morphogen